MRRHFFGFRRKVKRTRLRASGEGLRRAFGGPRDEQQRVILEAEAGRWPKLGVRACPAGGWNGGGQLLGRGGRRAKGRGAWGAVLVGGSDECEATDVGSWWQPVAFM